jgi:hypothetical protein
MHKYYFKNKIEVIKNTTKNVKKGKESEIATSNYWVSLLQYKSTDVTLAINS